VSEAQEHVAALFLSVCESLGNDSPATNRRVVEKFIPTLRHYDIALDPADLPPYTVQALIYWGFWE
jgi:hypothetical protein